MWSAQQSWLLPFHEMDGNLAGFLQSWGSNLSRIHREHYECGSTLPIAISSVKPAREHRMQGCLRGLQVQPILLPLLEGQKKRLTTPSTPTLSACFSKKSQVGKKYTYSFLNVLCFRRNSLKNWAKAMVSPIFNIQLSREQFQVTGL